MVAYLIPVVIVVGLGGLFAAVVLLRQKMAQADRAAGVAEDCEGLAGGHCGHCALAATCVIAPDEVDSSVRETAPARGSSDKHRET